MATRLTQLKVHEVSLVDKGANRRAFALKKADVAEDSNMSDTKVEPQKVEVTVVAAAPVVESVSVLKADGSVDEAALAKLPADQAAPFQALLKAQVALVEKAASLEKLLKEQADAKEVAEAITKAAVDFPNLPAKASDLGPALRLLRKADGVAAALIEDVLKKADALAKQALEPLGKATSAPAGETGGDKIETLAKAMVEKGEAKSLSDAYVAVVQKHPELYAAHVKGQ